MAVRTIAFDQGQNQGIESKLLDGRFSLVRNGVLAIDGQLRPRPGFTALATTVYGTGTFVAYDLFAYGERLCAFGDSMAAGYATDVFEYIEGGAAAWHPTVPSPTVARLPRATGVRDLPQPPDQQDGAINFGCSAFDEWVCLVWNNADAGGGPGFVQVMNADTGQTILFERLATTGDDPTLKLRVLELADRFIIVGTNFDGDQLGAWSFIPALNESLQLLNNNLITDASGILHINAARVGGINTQFVIAIATNGGDTIVRRYNSSGVLQVPSGGQYAAITPSVNPDRLAILAENTGNRITVGLETTGDLQLTTFNLGTGAQVGAGPFEPFAGDTVEEFGLVSVEDLIMYVVAAVTSETEPATKWRLYDASTNAFGTEQHLRNARLASTPLLDGSDLVFAVRLGPDQDSQSNTLVAALATAPNTVTPLVSKDFEVSTSASEAVPDLVRSATTGRVYWANAALSADGQASPRVTELELGSAARRQTCQVGALVLIAGGVPCIYDGVQLQECGYIIRPRIVSVTPSNGAGALLNGATYLYKTIWEALDSDDNIWRSPISETEEQVMGASDDTNTVVAEPPLSLRLNTGSGPTGSVVRVKLYRTVATVDNQPATVDGSAVINPPSGVLDGLTLGVFTIAGGLDTVTFSAAATTSTAILSEINAVLGSAATATLDGGVLRLTTAAEGEDVVIIVLSNGTANSILGFSTASGTVGHGSTTRTQGDVFHLCSTQYTALGADVGAYVTLVDVMSDDDLRAEQILYTQVEGPVEHFAPGPADLCSSGGSQVAVAGQPKRDRWTVSKPFAPNQGVQFANPGREKFSQRIRQDIEAIIQRDAEHLMLTSREIWQVTGEGPDREARGEFARPRLVYSEGGLKRPLGWRSVITTTDGTFFQLDDDKLYALTPGSGPTWIGHPVMQTLAAYPTITATCHIKGMQTLVFACVNAAGDDGVLLRYDLRRKQWFEDDVGPVTACAEYQGRLAIVMAGVVYLQDLIATGTMPTVTARLGDFLNFGAVGWGSLQDVLALLTYRGDCDVELQQALGGSQIWVTCGTYELRAAQYSAGDPVELQWSPALDECTRFALQLIISSASADSAGAWAHALEIHTDKQTGPARLSESRRR